LFRLAVGYFKINRDDFDNATFAEVIELISARAERVENDRISLLDGLRWHAWVSILPHVPKATAPNSPKDLLDLDSIKTLKPKKSKSKEQLKQEKELADKMKAQQDKWDLEMKEKYGNSSGT